jgi:large subunit ribosomal protein L30e
MAKKSAKEKAAGSKDDLTAISKAIRMCIESGEYILGARQSMQGARIGKGKLLVLAANAPKDLSSDVHRYCELSSIPILKFSGTSMELGSLCGKPFPVSMMLILDPGNSPILNFVKSEKKEN